jgi:hypothetical protein
MPASPAGEQTMDFRAGLSFGRVLFEVWLESQSRVAETGLVHALTGWEKDESWEHDGVLHRSNDFFGHLFCLFAQAIGMFPRAPVMFQTRCCCLWRALTKLI